MPTTFTAGYGGTMTINSTTIAVQNVTIEYSRGEMDVTKTSDNYVITMAGRITRRVTCSALVDQSTETLMTAVLNVAAGTSVALSWNDGNGTTTSLTKVALVSASRSYDGQGAATLQLTFAESL